MAALAAVHHFCLRPISSTSIRKQVPSRCQQTIPWAGYGHPRHLSFSVQNTGSGGIGTNAVLLRLSTLRLLSCIIRSSFRSDALIFSPKTQTSAGSMVLRNQQTDALNFVKLFYEKSPLLRGNSSYKRGLHPIISPESRKRGVQITSNASQTALTSMLETVKIGV